MSTSNCCHQATREPLDLARRASPWRRRVEIVGWIVPGATLVLLPKCPACVVMYVALFSGVTISFSSASTLRTSLLILCLTALLCLALKRVCRRAG
jgi:hypothetical protein